MADNVQYQTSTLATPPSTTLVSTEEVTTLNGGTVTAQHVQRVALASRTGDGVAVDLQGSTADGLLVNLGSNNDVTVTGNVATTAADGSSVVLGATTDAAVTTNAAGTLSAKLRGLIAILADVWTDAANALGVTLRDSTGDSAMDDANNAVRVNVVAGASGGVTHTDDAPFTPATDDGVPAFAVFDDTTPDSVDEGDAGALRMSANRNLYSTLRDAAGNERGANVDASNRLTVAVTNNPVLGANSGVDVGDVTINNASGASAVNIQDGGNSITIDGSVSVTGTVTVDSELPAAAALADNTANPTVPGVGAFGMAWDGTTWDRVPGTSTDGVLVNLGANNDVTDGGGSLTVDNGGTFAVQESGAALTALQLIDNIVHTEDEASADGHSGVLMLARRTATPANTSGADLDYEVPQMSAGRLWTSATVDAALPAGNNNIGDVDIVSLPNEGQQTMANSISVAIASDQGNVSVSQATASSFNAQVVGNIAHDGADSGNPVKIGGRAVGHGATPTAVAAADRIDFIGNAHGIQWTIGGHPNLVTLEAEYTTAQTNAAIVTVSAGTRVVVVMCAAFCDNANTVDVGLRIGFGTATTPTTTDVVLTHPGIAAGSGVVLGNGGAVIGIGADDADLRITSEVPTSGALRILVKYFTTTV